MTADRTMSGPEKPTSAKNFQPRLRRARTARFFAGLALGAGVRGGVVVTSWDTPVSEGTPAPGGNRLPISDIGWIAAAHDLDRPCSS